MQQGRTENLEIRTWPFEESRCKYQQRWLTDTNAGYTSDSSFLFSIQKLVLNLGVQAPTECFLWICQIQNRMKLVPSLVVSVVCVLCLTFIITLNQIEVR